ncbi:MAG TPA: hypothetical protein VGF56_09615, partial [Rhizomicrobium sp.]
MKSAPDCTMALFGANGDLTKRLVVPALYNLAKAGQLPKQFKLIGVDHNERTPDQWREQLRGFLESIVAKGGGEAEETSIDEKAWDRLASAMDYVTGDFTKPDTFEKLGKKLDGNTVFYLAAADRFFGPLVDNLAGADLLKEDKGWRRVVIEKPFGHDLESARALNARILKRLSENQIFRIDHFLGKETVQNIMVTRFASGLFEPIWNRDHIDHVQITASETVGVEGRGAFYDATGALRDMTPNHMFQLLSMIAMEPPNSFDAEAVRTEKARVVDAIKVQTPVEALHNSVRGQYHAGKVGGRGLADYRQEPN